MKSLFLRVLMVGVALGVIGCTDNKHPIENAEGTRRPLVSGPASPGVSYQPDPGGVAPVEVLTPPANVYYDQSNVPPDPSLEFAVALPGPGPQSASAWTTRDEFALAQAFQVLRVSDRSGFQAIAETVASPGRPGANGLGRGAIRSLPLAATGPAVYIVRFKEGTYLGRPFAAARPGKGEKYSWPSDYAARYNHPDLLFTVGSCPHTTWVQERLSTWTVIDRSVPMHEIVGIDFGLSEPIAQEELDGRVKIEYQNVTLMPKSVRVLSVVPPGFDTAEPRVSIDFDPPLLGGRGPIAITFSSAIRSKTGHAFAGAFHRTLSCGESDGVYGGEFLATEDARGYYGPVATSKVLNPDDPNK